MTATLDHWQKRLEGHFASLFSLRQKRDLPVFALEHGLDRGERASICALLHRQLRAGGRLGDHWLVWVVYAAEQGYDYDGEEYWATFEGRTPLWTARADRRLLRGWFQKFHSKYGGFKPTGPWASWFSIIAWPITHALLPKDLQHQLARALYQLRFALAARIDNAPSDIGRYIACALSDASSRFRNFLEQEEIAGRIVIALLDGRAGEAQRFIHPPTLERIVEDLQKARNARAWLRDARHAVERARMVGAARHPPGPQTPLGGKSQPSPVSPPAPLIRPSLTLRRAAASEWTPVLGLPSLRPIADLNPAVGQFLRRTRCTIAGSAGSLPAGWLLSGEQRRVITHWPPRDRPVVQFEQKNAVVEHLLESDGRITPGPLWLFHIGTDGLAREIIGRLVRPGKHYVLVSEGPVAAPTLAHPALLRCDGAAACELHLPHQLSAEQLALLRALGLSVVQTVRIWPAGLDARRWDGEGFTEWLEGETPCFALDTDHPIDGFDVQLDGEQPVHFGPASPGQPVFLTLPGLAPGHHTLVVRAKKAPCAGAPDRTPVEGFVSLVVRPPQPWIAGTTGHSGLVVTTEPAEPSLDQFWKGDARLQVLGPVGRHVRVCAELLDGAGHRLSIEQLADVTLPMNAGTWDRAIGAFLRKETDPWAYLSARAGNLVVDGGELGAHRVPLHRDASPVRWVWHKTQRATSLRLIDDHEGDEPLSIAFYPFATPTTAAPVARERAAQEWVPDGAGGLCVAAYGGQRQSLVVSMSQVEGGFSGLLIEPAIGALPPGDAAVITLLELVQLWSSARLVGPLASERRNRVLQRLDEHLVRLLCGADWVAAETAYARSRQTQEDLRQLAGRIGGNPAFAHVLSRDAALYRSMDADARLNRFAELAGRYGLALREACAAALELHDGLNCGAIWDRPAIERRLAAVRPSPVAMRGARLLAVAKPVQEPGVQAAAAARRR